MNPWECRWCQKLMTFESWNQNLNMHKDCAIEFQNTLIKMARKFLEDQALNGL